MHIEGFFAVVLGGSYVEAGDTGRHRVSAGDVLVHRPYEHHLDRFATRGAEVLVLPLAEMWPKGVLARVDDPDAIARIAERDIAAASQDLIAAMVETAPASEDWPDRLALDLLADPDLSLAVWADDHGLHPGSLARGFGQQFDISPAGFRTIARARQALEHIVTSPAPLSAIASEHGFADQAHMSRTIKRMTNLPPHALRRQWRGSHDERAA